MSKYVRLDPGWFESTHEDREHLETWIVLPVILLCKLIHVCDDDSPAKDVHLRSNT